VGIAHANFRGKAPLIICLTSIIKRYKSHQGKSYLKRTIFGKPADRNCKGGFNLEWKLLSAVSHFNRTNDK
jgi:hypothetical protein